MPATADTRAALPAPLPAAGPATPRHHARLVLLCALGLGLTGLALPGASASAPVPVAQRSTVTAPAPALVEPRASLPALLAAAPARPAVAAQAASRSRVRAARTRRPVGPAWVRPSSAGVVSPYGMRWGKMHWGVDFGAGYGAPIRSVGAGRVIGAGYLSGESGYGKIVLVRHAGGVVTAYAHMSRTAVSAGDRVKAGEVIGYVGNTGHSFGAHLHFEVRIGGRKVSPLPWLRARGVRV